MAELTPDQKAYAVIEAWDKGKYHGAFSGYDSLRGAFCAYVWDSTYYGGSYDIPEHFPAHDDILIAVYQAEAYSGSAFVLFLRGDQLFEVNGSHCSCNGLEECWNPEETTWAALKLRSFDYLCEGHPDAQERMDFLFRHFTND